MTKREKFNLLDFIIKYEDGTLTPVEIMAGFQKMINSGIVWHLQGSYGRTAEALIEAGICQRVGSIK